MAYTNRMTKDDKYFLRKHRFERDRRLQTEKLDERNRHAEVKKQLARQTRQLQQQHVSYNKIATKNNPSAVSTNQIATATGQRTTGKRLEVVNAEPLSPPASVAHRKQAEKNRERIESPQKKLPASSPVKDRVCIGMYIVNFTYHL